MAADPILQNLIGDILVVDDEISSLKLLTHLLTNAGYQVRPAIKPQLAIESALAKTPSLILMDVRMPEMDGFEVSRHLKQKAQTRDVPIIFVSAATDIEDKIQGFEAGGVDFISKPYQELEVLARVQTHLNLYCMQLKLEDIVARRTQELMNANQALKAEIIERQQFEGALKESRRFTDKLIESASVMIVGIDRQGNVTLLNPAGEMITGYASSELLGKNWFEIVVPEQRFPLAYQNFIRLLAKGTPKEYQNPILTKHGEERVITWSCNEIGMGGQIIGMISFGVDVTERVRMEEKLRKGREYLKRLTDSMVDVIFSVSWPERIIKWTNNAVAQLGYDPKECIGRTTDFLYASKKEFMATAEEIDCAIAKGKQVIRSEMHLKKKHGGLFYADVTISLFCVNDQLESITAVARNISERIEKEKRIQEYQTRLKSLATQLTIAEEKERRRIAVDLHDHVGQSLALARMQIASNLKRTTDSSQMHFLRELSASLEQTIQEARDLMYDLSPPQLNEIGLSAAISEWLMEFIESRYHIKTECIVEGQEMPLDATVRAILFRNFRELVTNVVKHAQASHVCVRMKLSDSRVEIIIRDNGIGFDADEAAHSHKPLSSFGLFSVKERMVDLGGSMQIASSPGQGTEAILQVPITDQNFPKGQTS
jgi:PAS domain S-box-containing protein